MTIMSGEAASEMNAIMRDFGEEDIIRESRCRGIECQSVSMVASFPREAAVDTDFYFHALPSVSMVVFPPWSLPL